MECFDKIKKRIKEFANKVNKDHGIRIIYDK